MLKIQVETEVQGLRSKHWRMVLMVTEYFSCTTYIYNVWLILRIWVSDKLTAKAQKITIKLPWEITTIYSEVLKQSGHQSDDEEDEDDIEAHEASIQRLKVCSMFLTHCCSLLM